MNQWFQPLLVSIFRVKNYFFPLCALRCGTKYLGRFMSCGVAQPRKVAQFTLTGMWCCHRKPAHLSVELPSCYFVYSCFKLSFDQTTPPIICMLGLEQLD